MEGAEWATFYSDLAAAFDLTIDALGPHFGDEALMDQLADSADLATLVGERDRYLWPAQCDLRRIPLRGPTPIYPHSLLWLEANPQPALAELRAYLAAIRVRRLDARLGCTLTSGAQSVASQPSWLITESCHASCRSRQGRH